MKALISVSMIVFGLIGAWIGGVLDHGNGLGPWSFFLATIVGPAFGIWAGYKAGKYWLD